MSNAKDFVAGVKLPPLPGALHPLLAATIPADPPAGAAAYVDDGCLIVFVADVSDGERADVLDSTLFAQAVASGSYDREEQPHEWYQGFANALRGVGWTVAAFEFEHLDTGGKTVRVNQVVLDALANVASKDELAVAAETLASVQSLPPDDGRRMLWESASHSCNSGNFQIALVSKGAGGLSMKLAGFSISTTQTIDELFSLAVSSSNIKVSLSHQTMTFNEPVYAQVRQQIIDRLGDHRQTMIQRLPIGNA